jgi:plasmid stabilization system protein ParE
MRVVIDPDALAELDEAAEFYEAREAGLGEAFVEEVTAAIGRALAHPSAFAVMSPRAHRAPVHRFPYGVMYEVEGDALRVFAVADLRRRPGYWRHRL